MLRDVFAKAMRDQRRALLWWALALAGLVYLLCAFFPSVRSSASELDQYMENIPDVFKNTFIGEGADYGSPAGYLNGELFSFVAPLLFLIYAIGAGSRAIAGEEEAGTLGLLLAYPVGRRRLALQKFAAVLCGIAVLAAANFAALLTAAPLWDMALGTGRLAEASLSLALLAVTFAALAFAVASASGRRALGIGVAAGAGFGLYLLNALAPLNDTLEPLRKLSLFYYYGGAEPLTRGLTLTAAAIYLGLTAALLVVALVLFERRDVRV